MPRIHSWQRKTILVCSGFCSKKAMKWVVINNRRLFIPVMETGESKLKLIVYSESGENQFPGSLPAVLLLCGHLAGRIRELSVAFVWALISFMRVPPS